MRAFFLKTIFCLFAITLATWNCSENPTGIPENSPPQLSQLRTPSIIHTGALKKYSFTVKVEDAQGKNDVGNVSYSMRKIGNGAAVVASGGLVDNGQNGDVLVGDGVFTTQIQGIVAQGDTGAFEIEFSASDKSGATSQTLTAILLIRAGVGESAPVILDIIASSTAPIDSAVFFYKIAALVSDGDGLSDIDSVFVEFFPPSNPTPNITKRLYDDGTNGDDTAGDGVFTNSFESSIFKDLVSYFFRVQAVDKSGNASERKVQTVQGRLKISQDPRVTAASVPRIVNVLTTGEIFISADVFDPEGLGDIDSVFVAIERNNEQAINSPRQLFDDGDTANSGDVTSGDGTFSTIFPLSVPLSGDPLEMQVKFTAIDKSGKSSNTFEEKLVFAFNDKPYISDLSAPSTITLNPNADQRFLVTLDVRDPQGLQTITLVQFRSFRPDDSEADDSPIQLTDDGDNDAGDAVAGDGIFSVFINLPAGFGTPGDSRRWVFQATESSGNVSNIIEHIVTLEDEG